jgi:hypothetical protein
MLSSKQAMLKGFRTLFAAALLLASIAAAALFSGAVRRSFLAVPGGHGCVNAGSDPRIDPFGMICALQRRYSYRSSREPRLHTHSTWAWGTHPFYFVYNRKQAEGNWLLIRLGWRYDRTWHGFIGPGFAWKEVPQPLLYY